MPAVDLIDYLSASGYEGELFPVVDECPTEYGHDFAEHLRLGGDGADCQPTGRKPVKVQLTIAFVSGLKDNGLWPRDLWPAGFERATELFRTRPQGMLSHPSRGPMRVQVGAVKEVLAAKRRNGVYVSIDFTQHLEDAGLNLQRPSPTADVPTAAASHAAAADALRPSGVPALSPTVTTQLSTVERQGRTYGDVLTATNTIVSACNAALTYPAAAASSGYEYRMAVERLVSAAWKLKEYYGAATNPRRYTVRETMSLARIAALSLVYGDPAKAVLLLAANRVPNPAFVPAGTQLIVPRP